MKVWKTQTFNGGMNDWTDGELLEANQSVLLQNADISTGKIESLKRPLRLEYDDMEHYGHFGTKDRSLVKWYERYYWSNNTAVEAPYYGGNAENFLGMPYPAYSGTGANVTITAGSASSGETGLTGKYRYCVTFVSANGWEGAPGSLEEYEKEIELDGQSGEITVSWSDERISYAKIYRTGNLGADFYNIGEIHVSGGTIHDVMGDDTLLVLNPLTTQENYGPPNRGKYLTEYGGVFFLAAGSLLYYSVQGNPHAWPTANFLNFDDEITGLVPEFQGILVFTQNHVFRVIGAENAQTISKSYIPGNHGCVNYRSISVLNNAPVWLSNDGICLWDGNAVTVVSYGRLHTRGQGIRYAVPANDQYILFTPKGGIVFDRKNGDIFWKLGFTCEYAWYDGTQDVLYLQSGGSIYQYGEGDLLKYVYESPEIHFDHVRVIYRELLIEIEGEGEVSFRVDGAARGTVKLTSGKNRLKLPFNTVGVRLQMRVSGKGELKAVTALAG